MKKMNAKLSQAENGISTSKMGISSWLGWETEHLVIIFVADLKFLLAHY
jgi:hypothetical protein